jgi:two-component system chemotaxis response regulator CheB
MRVLIVDDSAFMRRALAQMLGADPQIELVGSARNGREAVEMAEKLKPDVITLDIEMPEMDGLTALQLIMRRCPTQVIMLSSLTVEGSHAALRAMHLGAADIMAKEASQISLNVNDLQDELLSRIRALGRRKRPSTIVPQHTEEEIPSYRPGQFDVVCIGSSTGGPPVLEAVLKQLPSHFTTPIVVAQHMPGMFTRSMAQRLDQICQVPVVEAEPGMALTLGTIHICPGGRQTHLHRVGPGRYQLLVNDTPKEALYRPCVDVLFTSAAEAFSSRVLGCVFTGMGHDGLEGAKVLRQRGARLIAQSEQTCVVYGMPKAVTENGLIDASLAPEGIARALQKLARPAAPPASHPPAVAAPGQP